MGVMKKHQPVVKKKSESHEGAAEVSSPAEGEIAFPSSGVTILDGTDVVGSDAPENVLVVKNPFRNDLDIFWDESGSNIRFKDNRCRTSTPEGLCD